MSRPGQPPEDLGTLLRRLALPAIFVAAVAYTQLTYEPALPPASAAITELTGEVMGTDFMVKIRGRDLDEAQQQAAAAAVRGALDEVDQRMSTWKEDSELSRFNTATVTTPIALSPSTLTVFEVAEAVHGQSGGAFDITVGPLVERWGFGATAPADPPSAEEVAAIRERVGQDKLEIDRSAGTVSKTHPELSVDLSAVAKGYSVDQVAGVLEGLGYHDYLVEVGGEVRVGRVERTEIPWRLGVEAPDAGRRSVYEVVQLVELSMATSGDYRNFVVEEGQRRSHTIDPRTGYSVHHALASVTVLHERCADADAWATALMVLGPDEGLSLAEQQGLAAMFLSRGGDGAIVRTASTAFTAHRERLSQWAVGDKISVEAVP